MLVIREIGFLAWQAWQARRGHGFHIRLAAPLFSKMPKAGDHMIQLILNQAW